MLTSYQQYLDACRELCRAQAEVVATGLADAERVNEATGRLLDTLQARHVTAMQRIESARDLEELFDISATTLGEDIAAVAQTVLQMWREVAAVQVQSMQRLPAHVSQLGTLTGHVMQCATGLPQPLIPLGTWLYGIAPTAGARRTDGSPASSGTDTSGTARRQVAG